MKLTKLKLFLFLLFIISITYFSIFKNKNLYKEFLLFTKSSYLYEIQLDTIKYIIDQNNLNVKNLKKAFIKNGIKAFPQSIINNEDNQYDIEISYKNPEYRTSILKEIKKLKNNNFYYIIEESDRTILSINQEKFNKFKITLLEDAQKDLQKRIKIILNKFSFVTLQENDIFEIKILNTKEVDKEQEKLLFLNSQKTFHFIETQGGLSNLLWNLNDLNNIQYKVYPNTILNDEYIDKYLFDLSIKKPFIKIKFKNKIKKQLEEITKNNIGKNIAIVSNNIIIGKLRIETIITNNIITIPFGENSEKEAYKTFQHLIVNPFKTDFKINSQKMLELTKKHNNLFLKQLLLLIILMLLEIFIYIKIIKKIKE